MELGFALTLDPVDLENFFGRLPHDQRPDDEVIRDVTIAVWQLFDHARSSGQPQAWLDDVFVEVSTVTSLWQCRSPILGDSASVRERLERRAWCQAWLHGLDAARRPDAHEIDLESPLRPHHEILLWLHGQFDDEPWQSFDFDGLSQCSAPAPNAIGLALWRMATRSEVDQLSEPHRLALDTAHERGGFGVLAIEEGRRVAEHTDDPQPLDRAKRLRSWERILSSGSPSTNPKETMMQPTPSLQTAEPDHEEAGS